MNSAIKPGTRVQYAAKFLRSIGVHTGAMCFAVGEVAGVTNCGSTALAKIDWSTGGMPPLVNVANLVAVDHKHLERID